MSDLTNALQEERSQIPLNTILDLVEHLSSRVEAVKAEKNPTSSKIMVLVISVLSPKVISAKKNHHLFLSKECFRKKTHFWQKKWLRPSV